jgi:phosphosulfolactate phosphohydrolase-like enzyme
MASGKTLTIDSFPGSAFRHFDADAIVCMSVMLSSTALVTAVAQGRRAFVAGSEAEARSRAATLPDACLMGSLDGAPLEGFECLDSPTALLRQPLTRPLVLFAPPGTDLIVNAAECGRVLVASFRNMSATARQLANSQRVALLGAGRREEFSCEDQMAAAWIAVRMAGDGFEPADPRSAALIQRWRDIEPSLAGWGNSAELLRRAGRADDLDFVLRHQDDVDLPCFYRAGEVLTPARATDRGAEDPGGLPELALTSEAQASKAGRTS